jgi:hypothetical protein
MGGRVSGKDKPLTGVRVFALVLIAAGIFLLQAHGG